MAATVAYSEKVNAATARLTMLKDAHTDFTRALLAMRGFVLYADGAGQYEEGYRSKFKQSYENVQQYNKTLQTPDPEAAQLEKLLSEYQGLGDRAITAKKKQ